MSFMNVPSVLWSFNSNSYGVLAMSAVLYLQHLPCGYRALVRTLATPLTGLARLSNNRGYILILARSTQTFFKVRSYHQPPKVVSFDE